MINWSDILLLILCYLGGSSDMLADILPGLQVEGAEGDTPIPLQSINVMAKLVDLLAEVMNIFCMRTCSIPCRAVIVLRCT